MEHEHDHSDMEKFFDHLRQSGEVARHQIAMMIHEIDKDHLMALASLLNGVTSGGGKKLAALYQGVAIAELERRFNICSACGKDHDKQLAALTGPTRPQPTQEQIDAANLEKEVAKFKDFLLGPGEEVNPVELQVGGTGTLPPSQQARIEALGLDDLRDEETGALLGFVCLKCGKQYQSIDDRALDPDGNERKMCEGCIHKEKWG